MTILYLHMKFTGRSRLITEIYHSCFLLHWKLCHVWKLLLSRSWQQTYYHITMSTPITMSNVLTEFEYQLQLEFLICIESTVNYKYPNKFWSEVMEFLSNTLTWKCKYITAPPITICLQFLKQTLYCIIPFVHYFVVPDWN